MLGVRFNQGFFSKVDYSNSVKSVELPLLPPQVNFNHIIDADKIVTKQNITQAKVFFTSHPNDYYCTVLAPDGRRIAKFLKLQHPVDKTDHIYAYYFNKVGSGGYGSVKLLQDVDSGKWIAVKKFKYNNKIKDPMKGIGMRTNATYEYENLALLKKALGAVIIHCKKVEYDKFLLGMEYAPGVTLTDYLKREDKLTPVRWCQIAVSMLKSIRELHKLNYLHRDIKPDNMIYDKRTNQVRLVDYGFMARALLTKDAYYGTEYFISDRSKLKAIHDVKSDIFSAGMSLSLFNAFAKVPDPYLKNKIIDYINRMGSQNATDIPTLTEAIDFFTEIQNEFTDVLSKVRKIGIVDVSEIYTRLTNNTADGLLRAMRNMDVVWLVDTTPRKNEEYLRLINQLNANGIVVGEKIFQPINKQVPLIEMVKQIPTLCKTDLREFAHSLFYLTENQLTTSNSDQLNALNVHTVENIYDVNKVVKDEHLYQLQYLYAKRVMNRLVVEYREALNRLTLPNVDFENAIDILNRELTVLHLASIHKTLNTEMIIQSLSHCLFYNVKEISLAIDHLKQVSTYYQCEGRAPTLTFK